MKKYPIQVTWAQGKIPNTLCITWGKQHCLIPFVGSNLGGWDIFEKEVTSEKDAWK